MNSPLVAIGLPVYNGERYLRLALDSLLAQDYPNLTFIISDNASTDGTEAICRDFARRDSRISYHRNRTNIGAAANFNQVFHMTGDTQQYFMWASHDDLWHPKYISSCVSALESDSSLCACATNINFIDQDGGPFDYSSQFGGYNDMDTVGLGLRQRVSKVTSKLYWYAFYGVMRRKHLGLTRLYTNVFGGDVVLLMELMFQGGIKILPEKLFQCRQDLKTPEQQLASITGDQSKAAKTLWTDLARSLVAVINESCCVPWTKLTMRRDLITNIFSEDNQWKDMICHETGLERYQAKLLVDPEYWDFHRLMDRHVRWRFNALRKRRA